MLMGTEKEIEPKRTSNTEPSVAGKPAERRERFWDLKALHWVSVFLTIVLIGVGYLQYKSITSSIRLWKSTSARGLLLPG